MENLAYMTATTTTRIVYLSIPPKLFRSEFEIIASEISGKYIVNTYNSEVINQIYYYLVGNKKFTGDFNKGLFLTGGYGTGKTTLMQIISAIVFKYSKKQIKIISCVNLPDTMNEHGLEYFRRRPLILDELGRESQVVKDFGTERKLVPEIISMRYNERAWTFATSNFNMDSLEKLYGGYIADRMREMFNFLELKGKSFRK